MTEDYTERDPIILMQRAKDGDGDAFGQLYHTYLIPVFRYIYFRIRDKDTAEDLTQDVFLKVYGAISRFEHKDTSPLAYFFTVARNTVIDYQRKKKTIPLDGDGTEAALAALPDTAKHPEGTAEWRDTLKALREAIGSLTEEQQEVVVLRFMGELSVREVARLMQKAEPAVRQLQCRALRALRGHSAFMRK